MLCKNCGALNESEAKFCVSCGAELSVEETPVVEETPIVEEAPVVEETPVSVEPTYNAVPQNTEPDAQDGKGFAIAGMVLGIVSFFCFAVITGTLGIVFGAVAKSKGYKGGMATAGIVCGAIGIFLWILFLILGISII